MKMIMRWFGEKHDVVSLRHIRQIPGVTGVATSLMDKVAGEEWTAQEISQLRSQINDAGLEMNVIESVNVHDDIKLGAPDRDLYIGRYIKTLRSLGEQGVRVVCYNFMPMFDWMRTHLNYQLPDGSNSMAYIRKDYEALGKPENLLHRLREAGNGFSLPGWEPERLGDIAHLFSQYEGITTEVLHQHLKYFLDCIMPTCKKFDIAMAIHPDDPPWPIFGLPRVFASMEHAKKILTLNKSKHNALTLCTGSLGVNAKNDIPSIIRMVGDRIAFAHVRNFKRFNTDNFYESAHPSEEGSLDMYEIMKALHETAPDCYIRPDHGRMIWDEQARAGYGLYDRALGITYLLGLWEALEKAENADVYPNEIRNRNKHTRMMRVSAM